MIATTTKEAIITATPAERELVRWFIGRPVYNPLEWNDLMLLVDGIELLGYKVLICKYSCSIQNTANNYVIIRNPNQDHSMSKKETVWAAIVGFLKDMKQYEKSWLKK